MDRSEVKWRLLSVAGGVKRCPRCNVRDGQHYHEIICPDNIEGGKYTPADTPLNRAVFVSENGILLCAICNLEIGTGFRAAPELLALKMSDENWPPEEVIPALRKVAGLLKEPQNWIPRTVEVQGVTYTLLEGV